MEKCEICAKEEAERHHIVYKSEGGFDFPLNFKYLCPEHHRGKNGPHKNKKIDIQYKLELQTKLKNILVKDFYTIEELISILKLNSSQSKKLTKDFKLYKEGFKKTDIIKGLMGNKTYNKYMLEDIYQKFCQVL
ncbi:hypothetical protein CLOACE_01230 [Clostridium acetireducens DSM 10703]|uniref:HNH endonuclease n=1 Tax=Clostridium acetireducens DSM 10703 TaxID=1121290 RepID=A0A1E8F2B0_9CLOT|nr:HNH endonuclease signature motif containing protein [Clostridium acetireducens]OFI07775.1 hypothetical protein CLOACE_01230 [Clostridium acetireducens DSM 10703]